MWWRVPSNRQASPPTHGPIARMLRRSGYRWHEIVEGAKERVIMGHETDVVIYDVRSTGTLDIQKVSER